MPLRRRALLAVALMTLGSALIAPPADAVQARDRVPVLVRTYDVRDLLVRIPDFTDPPELGVAEPAARRKQEPEPEGKARETLLNQLVNLLSLREAPKVHDGQLVVGGTVSEHVEVAKTLAPLRERMATQVKVEARLELVGEAAMAEIAVTHPELARKLRVASFNGGDRTGTLLTAEEAGRLKGDPVSTPHVTLFSGQRAYVLVAPLRAFVGDIVARKGNGGEEVFDPVAKEMQSGVVLDAQATAAPDGRTVALNARLQCCTLHGLREAAAPGFPPEKNLKVQVPDYEQQLVGINAVVPNDVYLLFGCTETIRPNAPEGGEAKPQPLFAVVRVKVQRRQPAEVH